MKFLAFVTIAMLAASVVAPADQLNPNQVLEARWPDKPIARWQIGVRSCDLAELANFDIKVDQIEGTWTDERHLLLDDVPLKIGVDYPAFGSFAGYDPGDLVMFRWNDRTARAEETDLFQKFGGAYRMTMFQSSYVPDSGSAGLQYDVLTSWKLDDEAFSLGEAWSVDGGDPNNCRFDFTDHGHPKIIVELKATERRPYIKCRVVSVRTGATIVGGSSVDPILPLGMLLGATSSASADRNLDGRLDAADLVN